MATSKAITRHQGGLGAAPSEVQKGTGMKGKALLCDAGCTKCGAIFQANPHVIRGKWWCCPACHASNYDEGGFPVIVIDEDGDDEAEDE